MTTMEQAKEAAQIGMDRVAASAGTDWNISADTFLCKFARVTERFLAEDLVQASRGVVNDPHDRRAWGPVFNRAKRAGQIIPDGYARARTSNTSPKIRWRAVYFL